MNNDDEFDLSIFQKGKRVEISKARDWIHEELKGKVSKDDISKRMSESVIILREFNNDFKKYISTYILKLVAEGKEKDAMLLLDILPINVFGMLLRFKLKGKEVDEDYLKGTRCAFEEIMEEYEK
jgi:hypothetical protein